MFAPLCKHDVEKVDERPSIAVSYQVPDHKWAVYQPPFIGVPASPVEKFDLVLAIKCDGWPLFAQEWSSRSRCWPSDEIVQAIIDDGFHIVCKSSAEGDFRLSYSNAEMLLIQNLIDLQYTRKNAQGTSQQTSCNKSVYKLSTSCVRTVCSQFVVTSLEHVVNNL